MNKILLLTLLAAMMVINGTAKTSTTEGLKGKVKSVKETVYTAIDIFGEPTKGEINYHSLTKYDDNGNKIEYNHYNSDGSFSHKFTWKYDSKGKKIERYSSEDDILSLKETFTYDDKGNVAVHNLYNSDGIIRTDTYKYRYDNNDNWIERIKYESKANTASTITERIIEYYE
ncbi:MAG: hypothetical protein LBJ63_09670 [Prevotellaceae bacterium]|jgi:hypothetical protein|nr:hypothetical protein [Prevotellaceae bacterium]